MRFGPRRPLPLGRGLAAAALPLLGAALIACAAPSPTPPPTPEPTAIPTEAPPTATATISATATVSATLTAPPPSAAPTRRPPAAPTALPPPTAVPATPTSSVVIKFWADQTHLDEDTTCTAVNWETAGIKEVYVAWPGQEEEGKGGSGRIENVCIDKGEEVTFRMRVVLQDGSSQTREVTIKRDK